MDAFGNELEKVKDEPLTFNVVQTSATDRSAKGVGKGPIINGYPASFDPVYGMTPPQVQTIPIEFQFTPKKSTDLSGVLTPEEELWSALLALSSLLLVMAGAFLLGYTVGSRRRLTTTAPGTTAQTPTVESKKPADPLAAAKSDSSSENSERIAWVVAVQTTGEALPTESLQPAEVQQTPLSAEAVGTVCATA